MSSSAPLSGTDFLAKPRKLVLQLIGLAAKNLPNVISKLEERVDRHRSKIAFDHFPPPTRCQHSLLPQQKINLMVSKRKRVYTTLVIASDLPILTDIPRMTPKPAWRVAILQRPWKPDGRYGWLPAARAARTMVEGLIWLFSLASGRIPPVDCA